MQDGEKTGFTCSLSLDELYYTLLMRLIEQDYDKHPVQVIREDKSVISKYTDKISQVQDSIFSFNNFEIVSVDKNIGGKIPILMKKYQLLPRDCIHLQTMLNHSETDLLTTDKDFSQITSINSLLQNQL